MASVVTSRPVPVSVFGPKLTTEVVVVDDALVSEVKIKGDTSTGAVYDERGAIVLDSLRPSRFTIFRPVDPVSIDRQGSEFANIPSIPEAIFGGHFFFGGWGHFLVETLTAAAQSEQLPQVPVIYIPFEFNYESEWTDSFRRHAAPLLEVAWEGRAVEVLYRAQHVARLHVPQRMTAFATLFGAPTIHPASAQVYDRLRERFGSPRLADHIVLVTRHEDHRRFHPHERALYESLEDAGVRSLEPGTMSAEAQVREIAQAEVLIGFSGSALHNSVFMHPRSHVIAIGDQPFVERHDLQSDLARNAQQSYDYIPGYDGQEPRPLNLIRDDLDQSLSIRVGRGVGETSASNGG
jgi:CTP:molybdopterin cytidylyltransferase MocA